MGIKARVPWYAHSIELDARGASFFVAMEVRRDAKKTWREDKGG